MRYLVVILLVWLGVCQGYAQDYETDFREIQRLFQERAKSSHTHLQDYLQDYSYTPYSDEVHLMQGVLYVEKEKYKQAHKAFQKVEVKNLSRSSESMYYFYLGYANLQQEEYEKALSCMQKLKNRQNPYFLQATY